MKAVKMLISSGLAIAVCLFGSPAGPGAGSEKNEDHCFTCHTNPRKLIQITREIARTGKAGPGVSTETAGEG